LVVFVVSFGIAILLAYQLNRLFSVPVLGYEIPFFQNSIVVLSCVGIGVLTTLISGFYPAYVSTQGKPVQLLKRTSNSGMNESFRGSLTVFQFAVTIALLVASIAVIKQVNFMKEKDLGFTKNNTLVLSMNKNLKNNYTAFCEELKSDPNILQVAASTAAPGRACETNTFTVDGQSCKVWNWAVSDDYMEMMGFNIIEGRNFINKSEAEEGNFICNETAAKKYNWHIGTEIDDKQLVGIMEDFNMVSLRENVEPFVFHKVNSMNQLRVVSIKLQGDNPSKALQKVEETFATFCPDVPFRAFFLDDQLNLLYAKENQQSMLITFFSLLSVIVSMLGILGLSIFMCQKKIKEIGIRKVNGAKISEVMTMLNRDFVKWVAIAFVIATPLAYYAMHKWLENFAYKTNLSWWIFALAGVLALGIALLTVSWQSWKAATRNPVEALRYE